MYVKPLKINRNDLSDFWLLGVLECRNLSPAYVWKVGETVALVVLGPSQEVVSLPLCFVIRNVGPVVSRNRYERGTPRASSVVTPAGICGVVSQFCFALLERRVVDGNRQGISTRHFH